MRGDEGGELRGSHPMSIAVHRSPNKLWRSTSIFNPMQINFPCTMKEKILVSFFGELCDDGHILPRDETIVGRVVHEGRGVVILVLYAQADCGAPPFSVHKRRQGVDAQL
jgi:hypothetical protein